MRLYCLFTCSLIFISGCKSAYYTRHVPVQDHRYSPASGIIGLPLLSNGYSQSADMVIRREEQIDRELSGIMTSRYSSIQGMRQKHPELAEMWLANLSGNSGLETRLKVNSELCDTIRETSGCRYGLVSTFGVANWSDVNMMAIIYILPIPPMIVFGSIPIKINERPAGTRILACTMALVDLQEKKVLADEIFASSKNADPATADYPVKLLREMRPIERMIQVAKVRNEN